MPSFQVKVYKEDSTYITSTIIWPSSNTVDISCSTTSNIVNASPSERNLLLKILKCYLSNLQSIYSSTTSTTTENTEINNMLTGNSEDCRCALRYLSTNSEESTEYNTIVSNAKASEIKDFVNNYLVYFIKLLENTFMNDIRTGMLDSYGNIVNYSMKNEIVRLKAPLLSQYVYKS